MCMSLTALPLPQPQTREQLLEEGSGCEEATGILDLELSRLTFHHHPLFSPEHVLTAQLLAAHTAYTQRMEVGVAKVLQNKLQVRKCMGVGYIQGQYQG